MTNIACARLGRWVFVVLWVSASGLSALAQAPRDVDQEFEFASGLVEWGFPDFAEKVVQNVLRYYPDLKDRAKLIQAQVLIRRGKYEEAEKIIQEMGLDSPKAQAIGLALARAYYAIGETEKARAIYTDFFKRYEGRVPTDPDLLRFYREACYQFGQMSELSGDYLSAIKAYGRVLDTKVERPIKRRILVEQARLYVKAAEKDPNQRDKYLKEAQKLCEEVQWGGNDDIWFGHSLVTMAYAYLVQGDRSSAEKLLTSNLDILKPVDELLKEMGEPLSVSPMAGVRFLLGQIYESSAKQMEQRGGSPGDIINMYGKALSEYYNVFVKYGESDYGRDAGVRAGEIKSILETRYNKQVKIDLKGAVQKQAVAQYFQLGDTLFRQRKYAEAIAEYLKNLNQFPETDESARVLGNLMVAYAELGDVLMVKAVMAYVGERFAGNEIAANSLLQIGKYFFDKNDERMYMLAYNTYLKYFPQHPRAGAVLFTLAGHKRKQGDIATANALLERIVKEYPKDPNYAKALSTMAWSYFAETNLEKAVEGFRIYIKESQPGPERAKAQMALADSLRLLGRHAEAAEEYKTLIEWLAPKDNPYAVSAQDVAQNQKLLERAVFQRAVSFSKVTGSPETVQQYLNAALKAYDQFLAVFPNSEFAPTAMSGKGAVLMALGQHDAAAKTYDELAKRYPNSEEGKSALYALIRSAMEIGLYDQAKAALDKMVAEAKSYSAEQFALVGQRMLEAKLYPEAIKAFSVAKGGTEERRILERVLFGLGKSYFELKEFGKAIEALEELAERYPKSGLLYDVKMMLGAAYREQGKLKEAIAALTDAFKVAGEDAIKFNTATYELGLLQKQQGDLSGAMASFLRVGLFADVEKYPQLSAMVEDSLLQCIELGMQLGRYADVEDSCDLYVKLFPKSDKVPMVRERKSEARIKAATAGTAPASASSAPSGAVSR